MGRRKSPHTIIFSQKARANKLILALAFDLLPDDWQQLFTAFHSKLTPLKEYAV